MRVALATWRDHSVYLLPRRDSELKEGVLVYLPTYWGLFTVQKVIIIADRSLLDYPMFLETIPPKKESTLDYPEEYV